MPIFKSTALFLSLVLFAVGRAFNEDSAEIMACIDVFRLVVVRFEEPSAFVNNFKESVDICLPYIDRVIFKDSPACKGTGAKPDERRCKIATEAAQIYSDLMELKLKLDGLIFKAFTELFASGPMLAEFPARLELEAVQD